MKPDITVIIPTYNRAHMIEDAIKSVQHQKYQDWELLVIDDASTDHTNEIVAQLIRNDNRIKYIRHKKNLGGNVARNLGVKESKGHFISFLDDDDTICPEKLSLQYEYFLKNPKNGLIYSGFEYVDAHTDEVIKIIKPRYRGKVLSDILRNNILGSPTPLIKRECFKIAGNFDEDLRSSQDWDLWIRIAQYFEFDYIDAPLAKVSLHGNQISVNLTNKIQSRKVILNKYGHLFCKKTRALHLKRIGVLYALKGSTKIATITFKKSIKDNPIDYLTFIHYFLSYFPTLHRKAIEKVGLFKHGNITIYM
jgi:glycosyltransferase involved in cell wall biosynthesis